jgi:uncharacterized protein (TIGR02246 family)
MRALAGLFHEDAEWVNVVGMYWRGKDALVTAHATLHDAIFKKMAERTRSAVRSSFHAVP